MPKCQKISTPPSKTQFVYPPKFKLKPSKVAESDDDELDDEDVQLWQEDGTVERRDPVNELHDYDWGRLHAAVYRADYEVRYLQDLRHWGFPISQEAQHSAMEATEAMHAELESAAMCSRG